MTRHASSSRQDIAVMKKCRCTPGRLARWWTCSRCRVTRPVAAELLLSQTNSTTLIAGDAIATAEHLEQGRVLRGAYDVKQAQESFMEAVEIADVIVPGHDNMLLNQPGGGSNHGN
ncbi:MAG: hypothetical protein R3C45_08640 [Phycisphaerales bacterium]